MGRDQEQRAVGVAPAPAPAPGHDARGATPAPGKETLAQRGVSGGGGGGLPHRDAIQRSFGPDHDLSGVRAHVGGSAADACDRLGADGYATGKDVAFASEPSLFLAAHEAAHVVQQRSGVSFSGVGSADDPHERNADAVAARVVAGESAADLLPRGGGCGGGGVGAVQLFRTFGKAEQGGKEGWAAGGVAPLRVSDDGTMAVLEERDAGGHVLYAEASLLKQAHNVLLDHAAPIALRKAGVQLQGLAPETGEPRTLELVRTGHDEGQKDGAIEMPDDCGKCAHEVTGATAKGGSLRARTDGQLSKASGHGEMKREVLLPALLERSRKKKKGFNLLGTKRKLVDEKRIAEIDGLFEELAKAGKLIDAELAERRTLKQSEKEIAAWYQPKIDHHVEQHKIFARMLDNEIVKAWDKLEPGEQSEISAELGINEWADPEMGEAYSIVSGGERYTPGAFTYNVHWAAVIMKSGGDAVTMENSAQHQQVRNTDWSFQMYGVPTGPKGKRTPPKPGQSFHEQQRDVGQAHGKSPTTLVTHNDAMPISGVSNSNNPEDEE